MSASREYVPDATQPRFSAGSPSSMAMNSFFKQRRFAVVVLAGLAVGAPPVDAGGFSTKTAPTVTAAQAAKMDVRYLMYHIMKV